MGGATVAHFRFALGGDLPSTAKVLANKPGRGPTALLDTELVPAEVTLTEFHSKRNLYVCMNEVQVHKVFLMQKAFFKKAENQRKLDKLQKEAGGDDTKYGFAVTQLLMTEVYPVIAHRY